MELILKNDVPNLGFKDDIVSVKNGYGRNFLIPQGFAILATSSSKKVLAENIKQREFKEKKLIDEAKKVAKKLNKLEIKIPTKCGKGGKLFGSISNVKSVISSSVTCRTLLYLYLILYLKICNLPCNTHFIS